ncbi:MAG: type III restriction-modification system subunit R [Candidatus Desulfovibrio kirbyi]|uniref:Type I restriction enzyme endonuclease subunit n=1 Tax=Candidatus Desulfovibrio kirbyi TaxID=2696086 RepID=A0A6L2R4I9_9BACT|nr:MAG: type III restriction-modification system subunit R [Candidatus Desulfovibrio kirbyi]
MVPQSEYALEDSLIGQLMEQEFSPAKITNEQDMLTNLSKQLGKHNGGITFSDEEFKRVLSHLNTGGTFERAKILRDRYALKRDNGDTTYIEFFNCDDWCRNEMQVCHQVTIEGKRKNRYDVTLLFNGLPLVQIELKRRGAELKVAFNQINRYQHDSYDAGYGLFQYVQLFIISSGVNTRYFANNRGLSYQFAFTWTDEENKRVSDLHEFVARFLKPCHITKMISHYTVLNETQQCLMIMRPYQVYASEAIINRVKTTNLNGYIWHTTGSGKTLTSFKASQVIMHMPKVHKVLFVVDRKDLDHQTAQEFNSFSKGSVDTTTNTKTLVKQLNDPSNKLIVTTIQKLNTAITKDRHLTKISHLQDEKFVIIFDECHRSQFGDTHKNIKKFFGNAQMFGFTGTPIFKDNALTRNGLQQTTRMLFDECLHKYVIVDAIRYGNVLPFSVEYMSNIPNHPKSIEKITEYILKHHRLKTKFPNFTGMLCVDSIDALIEYYRMFKEKQKDSRNPLKIATIFSYAANPDVVVEEAEKGFIEDEIIDTDFTGKISKTHRDSLDACIADYNQMFGTSYNANDSQSFYAYYNNIADRVKKREIHILLVVSMFLTGFDSKYLNTLYVDKNLRFHGLLQAFSRTNRTIDERKSHGNIVCFRDLKEATDEAITLFSNKDAKDLIILKPYEEYVKDFNEAVQKLFELTPTVQSVDDLSDENAEKDFIEKFRYLLRIKNILSTFVDYAPDDLDLDEQTYEDYKSKYLDLYERHKKRDDDGEPSIIDDVDFELTLIRRDEINVAYILMLLTLLAQTTDAEEFTRLKREITNLLASEIQLRGKRQLITDFMDKHLLDIPADSTLEQTFERFINEEKDKAFTVLCAEEDLKPESVAAILEHYMFSGRFPRQEEIIQSLAKKIGILQRKSIYQRVDAKLRDFIDTFIDGMGGVV